MSKQAVKQIEKTTSKKATSLMAVNPTFMDTVDRHGMIACEAYLRAEKRGFQGGDPVLDWLEAEAKVDRGLSA